MYDCISDDVSLKGGNFADFLVELGNVVSSSNILSALRTPKESPGYVLLGPASAEVSAEALCMENVAAANPDTGLLIFSINLEGSISFFAVN